MGNSTHVLGGVARIGLMRAAFKPTWYRLRTKHRQERILGRELAVLGLNCFCPVVLRAVQYGVTEVIVEQPVCPDEAFLFGSESDVALAKTSPRVISCRPAELEELLSIAALVDSAALRGISISDTFVRAAIPAV